MSPGAPTESNSRLRPTTPFSGSAHNSQSPLRQISLPPSPAPRPAARSPTLSSSSPLSPRNRSPSSPRQRPPTPTSHPRFRCPPPAQSALPHNSPVASCHRGECRNPDPSTGHTSLFFHRHLDPFSREL